MKKQKVFIVEDEKHNRDMLMNLLDANFSKDIEIVGSSPSVLEAVEFLKHKHADILFLDIELSDGQVFDLLNKIDYKAYKLIFITGYSEHAIKAIKYAAIDYLLKPISTSELIIAVSKVLEDKVQHNPILDDLLNRKQFDIAEYLVIKSAQAIEKIAIETISHLRADGVYTNIFHGTKTTISSKPIGIYEDVLPASQFMRCHKSFIVNKYFIKRVGKGRGLDLILHSGEEVQVAVRKKDEFMHWFNG